MALPNRIGLSDSAWRRKLELEAVSMKRVSRFPVWRLVRNSQRVDSVYDNFEPRFWGYLPGCNQKRPTVGNRGAFLFTEYSVRRLFHRFQVEEDVEACAVPESFVDVLVVVVRP